MERTWGSRKAAKFAKGCRDKEDRESESKILSLSKKR